MAQNFSEFSIEKFEVSKHGHLIEELTEMLHEAYRPLAEQGMKYQATHQPPETTLYRLRKGSSFLGFIGDELVSTVTLVMGDPEEMCLWYKKPEVYFFTQFAVKTSWQRTGLGKTILDYLESYAAQNGAMEIALDTSEHAHRLITMYKNRYYRFIEYIDWDVTNYRSVILSKNLQESNI